MPPRSPIRLLDCPNIGDHTIQRCDAQRTLIMDGGLLRFTPTEYRLLLPLLEQAEKPLPFGQLVQTAFSCAADRSTSHLLHYHVDHLCSKLRTVGLNVYHVVQYGYLLTADTA